MKLRNLFSSGEKSWNLSQTIVDGFIFLNWALAVRNKVLIYSEHLFACNMSPHSLIVFIESFLDQIKFGQQRTLELKGQENKPCKCFLVDFVQKVLNPPQFKTMHHCSQHTQIVNMLDQEAGPI